MGCQPGTPEPKKPGLALWAIQRLSAGMETEEGIISKTVFFRYDYEKYGSLHLYVGITTFTPCDFFFQVQGCDQESWGQLC
jgi:hypothetical protein